MRLGVISDTHGLLRPEALAALRGVDHLLHAGDVGDPEILYTLATLAPVTAVRGNIDVAGPCANLPATEMIELDGHTVYMLHIREELDLLPEAAGVQLLVYGHSHRPALESRNGVLYLNPGSAGPRRFQLPVTVALVDLTADGIRARIVPLLTP
ncbi:MAG: metallophosphoesterase family protein [Acidobacteriota bacterium]|nr:metallophosphoesterase family protein [Acidobacteriota bacterium]